MGKLRVAIVGVGNCASSLVQGVQFYAATEPGDHVPGLMHVELGGYHVRDIEFVAAFDVDAKKVGRDLSEAIRSGEILSRLRIGYRIRHHRGYGGNVVAMMFPDINVDLLTDEIVNEMIASDRSVLQSGEPSFHSVIVAEPKTRPLPRLIAFCRYLAEPKLRRIARELRRLF